MFPQFWIFPLNLFTVAVEEANLVVVAPDGLEGIIVEGDDDDDQTKYNNTFSTKFFQNVIDSKGPGSKLSFTFNSLNYLVCYANSRSPNFSVKITQNDVDLDEDKHHVTKIETPEEEGEEEFSLDVVDDKFYWKAVVVSRVDHSFHKKSVTCVAQAPQQDALATSNPVSVECKL